MDKTQGIFTGCMLLMVLVASGWMAVGLWPTSWIMWRAGWGDQRAVEFMLQEAYRNGDVEAAIKWTSLHREMSEREMVFMLPDARRVMRKLHDAQGIPTPLLDAIND